VTKETRVTAMPFTERRFLCFL